MAQVPGPTFAVNCVGHDGGRGHTEYLFRVRHSGGCEWLVQRRYQELQELHERLTAVFGASDLPDFPPRTSATSLVGALLGAGSAGRQPTVVAARERAFQRYFDALCDRRDVLRTQCLQVALAVAPPEPVSHLRVRGWRPPDNGGQGLTALLDIRPEGQRRESSAVAEAYHVVASLVFETASPGVGGAEAGEELCPVADFRFPAMGSASQARVECLKPGAQVELRVTALNAVGESTPVSIRVRVPAVSSAAAGLEVEAQPRIGSREPSMEAEQLDAAMMDRQMADFRAEREALDRKRGEAMAPLDRQGSGISTQAVSESLRSPALLSPLPTPCITREPSAALETFPASALSPREEAFRRQAEQAADEAAQLRRASEAQQAELRLLTAEREAMMDRSSAAQRAEREALEREKEELRAQREELRMAAEASERACATRAAEIAAQQDSLERQRVEVAGSRAAEEAERAARLEELRAKQAELDARKAELLEEKSALEESRRFQVDDLRDAEAELLRRAERLKRMEQALDVERRELNRSRASLAMVQAHVVSMLDKVTPGAQGAATHRLDDVDADVEDPAGESQEVARLGRDASVDGVWGMDWTVPFPDRSRDSPAGPDTATPVGAG